MERVKLFAENQSAVTWAHQQTTMSKQTSINFVRCVKEPSGGVLVLGKGQSIPTLTELSIESCGELLGDKLTPATSAALCEAVELFVKPSFGDPKDTELPDQGYRRYVYARGGAFTEGEQPSAVRDRATAAKLVKEAILTKSVVLFVDEAEFESYRAKSAIKAAPAPSTGPDTDTVGGAGAGSKKIVFVDNAVASDQQKRESQRGAHRSLSPAFFLALSHTQDPS
jgi:hypothetical protein